MQQISSVPNTNFGVAISPQKMARERRIGFMSRLNRQVADYRSRAAYRKACGLDVRPGWEQRAKDEWLNAINWSK